MKLQRKNMPDIPGQLWCYVHQRYEPVEDFYKCATRTDGYSHACKTGIHEIRSVRSKRERVRQNNLKGLNFYRSMSPVVFF